MANKNIDWMKKGIEVFYRPKYYPKGEPGQTFRGRISQEPFLMGDPKNQRWVVHIGDMDEKYQALFGRTVQTCAAVKFVEPVHPIDVWPELLEV